MKGILFIGLFFLMATCTPVSEQGATENAKSTLGSFYVADLRADSLAKVNEQAFEDLLSKAVQQRLIESEDAASRDLLHRFFPNTSRFEDYQMSIEPIALRDSFWLILYEFITDGEDKNQMFLGSFRKTGQIIDLLEMHPISFDGHISLSLLEDNVLEIEYRDFKIKSDLSSKELVKNFAPTSIVTDQVSPARYFIKEDYQSESSGTKYYRLQSNGTFESFNEAGGHQITRVFPQSSERILTIEELERLSLKELELLRNELYASYGFIFEEGPLTMYFQNQGWYKPDSSFTTDRFSDIEKVNLEKMSEVEGKSIHE